MKVFVISAFAVAIASVEHAQHQSIVVNDERMMVSSGMMFR
jgi:hypothetical protein